MHRKLFLTLASLLIIASVLLGIYAVCWASPGATALADTPSSVATVATSSSRGKTAGMVLLRGGTFQMGTDTGKSHEGPAHNVTVRSFWIDRHDVTVAQFAAFVQVTGYRTESEQFGWSGVFDSESGKWTVRDDTDWRHPDGPGSEPRPDEPVTQVSWNDAIAYARWAGKRLLTEAEWEYAARGGLVSKTYAWGDELRPGGKPMANWWQGIFPERNTAEDGFLDRSSVGAFPPNGYGLYDMAGNVWQWVADWYDEGYYTTSPEVDPQGPDEGTERVLRGGSFLCAKNFCTNYRVAGRSHATPDSALNNTGFRCARDATLAETSLLFGLKPLTLSFLHHTAHTIPTVR